MSENENKIKVAQYVGVLGSGGIETFTLNLFEHIEKTKFYFDFIVDSSKNTRWDSHIQENGGKKITIQQGKRKKTKIFRVINKYIRLRKIFAEGNYQVAHIHMSYPTTLLYCMLAKKAGIPTVIAHSHSSSFGKSGAIMKRKSRIARFLFAKYCDYLFADSKKAGEFMFNRDDVEVIRMGIDSKKYVFDNAVRKTIKQKLGINESTTVLGHVGRFAYAKNHKFLIEIFDEYQKINPNSVLVLVGEGDLCEEIRKKVEILGLQKSVIFYGFTDKVYEIMQAMDIFVLPSHSEGLGIVAIEAQASGMPIVVSTAVPREAVLLCNAHTIELSLPAKDWAMKIQQVLNTEKRIPTSQQTIIDAGFDIQTVTEHLQEIYSS